MASDRLKEIIVGWAMGCAPRSDALTAGDVRRLIYALETKPPPQSESMPIPPATDRDLLVEILHRVRAIEKRVNPPPAPVDPAFIHEHGRELDAPAPPPPDTQSRAREMAEAVNKILDDWHAGLPPSDPRLGS